MNNVERIKLDFFLKLRKYLSIYNRVKYSGNIDILSFKLAIIEETELTGIGMIFNYDDYSTSKFYIENESFMKFLRASKNQLSDEILVRVNPPIIPKIQVYFNDIMFDYVSDQAKHEGFIPKGLYKKFESMHSYYKYHENVINTIYIADNNNPVLPVMVKKQNEMKKYLEEHYKEEFDIVDSFADLGF